MRRKAPVLYEARTIKVVSGIFLLMFGIFAWLLYIREFDFARAFAWLLLLSGVLLLVVLAVLTISVLVRLHRERDLRLAAQLETAPTPEKFERFAHEFVNLLGKLNVTHRRQRIREMQRILRDRGVGVRARLLRVPQAGSRHVDSAGNAERWRELEIDLPLRLLDNGNKGNFGLRGSIIELTAFAGAGGTTSMKFVLPDAPKGEAIGNLEQFLSRCFRVLDLVRECHKVTISRTLLVREITSTLRDLALRLDIEILEPAP